MTRWPTRASDALTAVPTATTMPHGSCPAIVGALGAAIPPVSPPPFGRRCSASPALPTVRTRCPQRRGGPRGPADTIRRGKTDQEGLGRKVAIPRGDVACPVEAVRAWREAAGIVEGALFRRVWNRRAQRVGAQRLTPRIAVLDQPDVEGN
jgi:hypothetical protein